MKVQHPEPVVFNSQLCNLGGNSHWVNKIIYGDCPGRHDGKKMGEHPITSDANLPF